MRSLVFIFFSKVKPVISREVVTIIFYVLLQIETVCANADKLRKCCAAEVDGKRLTRIHYTLVAKNNVLIETKQQCAGKIVSYHIFVLAAIYGIHLCLCLITSCSKKYYQKKQPKPFCFHG